MVLLHMAVVKIIRVDTCEVLVTVPGTEYVLPKRETLLLLLLLLLLYLGLGARGERWAS